MEGEEKRVGKNGREGQERMRIIRKRENKRKKGVREDRQRKDGNERKMKQVRE